MVDQLRRVKQAVADEFGIEFPDWKELSIGRVNSLYLVGGTYVVRVTVRRDASALVEEIELVRRIREAGFDRVCNFCQTSGGSFVLPLPDCVTTVYRFVDGIVNQPLSGVQFSNLVQHLPAYFSSIRSIRPSLFPSRRHFPTPDIALERARSIRHLFPQLSILDPYLSDFGWIEICRQQMTMDLIHGDLHGGNLVWDQRGDLLAIIDFERFCVASQAIEIGALMTGTCFEGTTLLKGRLVELACRFSAILTRELLFPERIVDVAIFVALYYFGRVNRQLIRQNEIRPEEYVIRDAMRAVELACATIELKEAVRDQC